MTTNPLDLTASELSIRIHRREISCRQVMEAFLDRVAARNPAHNAIVALVPSETLLKEADERDSELARGIDHGWMHGFPIAVKDLAAVRGLKSTAGCILFRDVIATKDSLFVKRMRESGAIFVGRTNVPEFGLGSHTYNSVYGRTGNAYNPDLSSGGSSGGASVALALNLVPVADGSDMMGSLRNPAGWNGIYGFRPTFGVIPQIDGGELFFGQIATEGPMARNVDDLRRLFEVMAGYHPLAPLSFPTEKAMDPTLPSQVKVAWLGNLGGYLAMEPRLLEQCHDACSRMAKVPGVASVDAVVPEFDWPELWKAWCSLRSWLTAGLFDGLGITAEQRKSLKPEAQWEYNNGAKLSALDVTKASVVRTRWWRKLQELFAEYDFLVLPSAQLNPFPKHWDWPHEIDGKPMDTYHRWMEVTIYASLCGLPVISIPAGLTPLPYGLQVIGPKMSDGKLLSFAKLIEGHLF